MAQQRGRQRRHRPPTAKPLTTPVQFSPANPGIGPLRWPAAGLRQDQPMAWRPVKRHWQVTVWQQRLHLTARRSSAIRRTQLAACRKLALPRAIQIRIATTLHRRPAARGSHPARWPATCALSGADPGTHAINQHSASPAAHLLPSPGAVIDSRPARQFQDLARAPANHPQNGPKIRVQQFARAGPVCP